jgi:hypothetical protein
LTVNFNRDYPGGVTIDGALKVAEIIPQQHHLVVHGRISYVTPAVPPVTEGFPPKVIKPGKPASTVFVDEEIRMLQSQTSDLVAKVAALEAKIG